MVDILFLFVLRACGQEEPTLLPSSERLHNIHVVLLPALANGCESTGLSHRIRSISDIPIAALQAELVRRRDGQDASEEEQPSCGSTRSGAYNTPVHVMALFLILVLSTLGMGSKSLFLPGSGKKKRTAVTDPEWPIYSMFLSSASPSFPSSSDPSSFSLPFQAFWNRGPDCYGVCPFTAHGVYVFDRSLSS